MYVVKAQLNKKEYVFQHPQAFDELTPTQYAKVIELAYNSAYDIPQQLELLFHLLSLPGVKKKFEVHQLITEAVNNGYADSLLVLQKFVNEKIVMNKWLVPFIRVKKHELFGPLDRFSYMKFGEFIYADMLFLRYMQSNNEQLLNNLIAVLYRPVDKTKAKSKDKRMQFNSEEVEYYALKVAELSAQQKQAVLINYAGIRTGLENVYPHVFAGKKESNNITAVNLGTSQNSWLTVRRQLADSVLNLEKIDNTLLSDVLNDFNEKLSKNE